MKARESRRKWRLENLERARALARARYHKNAEKVKAQNKAWAKRNHARVIRAALQRVYRRRSLLKNAGTFSEAEWQALLDRTGHKCLACDQTDVPLTVDHIVPLSCGGSNRIENIQPLCATCNKEKGATAVCYLVEV